MLCYAVLFLLVGDLRLQVPGGFEAGSGGVDDLAGFLCVTDADDAVGDRLRGFLEVLDGEDVRDRADVVAVEARVPVINYWRELGTNLPQEDLNTLFTFLSHGSKQVILLWTENGFDKSPAALAREVGAIVDHSVSHFLPQTKI